MDGPKPLTGEWNKTSGTKPPLEGYQPNVVRMAYDRIGALIRNFERLHYPVGKEGPEYPTFAWQDALVNAVAHRDDRDVGQKVDAWLLLDR